MPVLHTFHGEVLVLRAVGTYSLEEVERALRAALAEPERPTLRSLLYDARESTVAGARSTPEVRQAVRFFDSVGDQIGRRIALLATTDVAYGVMRMVAGWSEGCEIDVDVFRDADEAFAWANRPRASRTS